MDLLDMFLYLLREEGLQILVAIFVNFWLFFYHVKVKGYKYHYWLFNFFPTVIASMSPDGPYAISHVINFFRGGRFVSGYIHDVFHNIFVSWIFIMPIILFIFLLIKLGKVKRVPKDWVYYVIAVSLVAMLIHLYIMDPLGF